MPLDALVRYFHAALPQALAASLQILPSGARARYRGWQLSSVFQPLLECATGKSVAYEALLRGQDTAGIPISPEQIFLQPQSDEEAVYLDRLCRVIHALNFIGQPTHNAALFLNISGRHLQGVTQGSYGETFDQLLSQCGLSPEQIILEILEAGVDDIGRLQDAVCAYRQRGYRVAIDDFGCEHSNFDRLWRLTPDIVKLDRSLLLQSTVNLRARRIMPKLVDIIHELGAQVVCEGVETREQHQIAVDAGADFVQGYYYAPPASKLACLPDFPVAPAHKPRGQAVISIDEECISAPGEAAIH